eukprot:9538337-Ditylum_brightwellii.AAC.2
MGIHQCPNALCIFTGTVITGHPPIYIGLHVDDFIYFSALDEVEREFERQLKTDQKMLVEFIGKPTHFLGIHFETIKKADAVTIFMSQEATIEALVEDLNFMTANPTRIPYRSGYPVDKILTDSNLPQSKLDAAQQTMRQIVGSLNWLSCGTRLDIATITNILAQYFHTATPSHVAAAKYV